MTLNGADGNVSITLRGFDSPPESLFNALNREAQHYGERGSLYRGRVGTKNSQSYIFNKIDLFNEDNIEDKIRQIISIWGGEEKLKMIIEGFSVRDAYIEVLLDKDRVSPMILSKDIIGTLYRSSMRLMIALKV